MAKSRKSQMTLRKRQTVAGSTNLPIPIHEGEVLTDISKKAWKIGKSVGVGGFGEIYLASDDIYNPVSHDATYVIKIEPHKNGPLFVEMNFYLRVAKKEMIRNWMAERRLKFLGMPHYVASGSHMYQGEKFRFLVLQRFGQDLGKLFTKKKHIFHIKTVLTLGIQIIDILEYIHSHGYIHADIKGSNLLLGTGPNGENEVHLLDYGLACRYVNGLGVHKEFNVDQRKAHDGTLEYTSRDAHMGAHSRRGDLEILGYNMIQWLTGSLPWEDEISDPEKVAEQKNVAMNNIQSFLKECFPEGDAPVVLQQYLKYIGSLNFESKPDYSYCKSLLRQGIRHTGYIDDNKLNFNTVPAKLKSKKRIRSNGGSDIENMIEIKPVKIPRNTNRQPCVAVQQNTNRMTRQSAAAVSSVVLRSHEQFDWVKVLQSNPERLFSQHYTKKKKSSLTQNPKTIPEGVEVIVKKERVDPLENPTPAITEVIRKRTKVSAVYAPGKRCRSDSRCNSPVVYEKQTLTPAMEDVLKRREQISKTDDDVNNFQPIQVEKVHRSARLKSRTEALLKPVPRKCVVSPQNKLSVTNSGRKKTNVSHTHTIKPLRKISVPEMKSSEISPTGFTRIRTRKYSLQENKFEINDLDCFELIESEKTVDSKSKKREIDKCEYSKPNNREIVVESKQRMCTRSSKLLATGIPYKCRKSYITHIEKNKKLPTLTRSLRTRSISHLRKTRTSPFVFKPKARREVSPSEVSFVPRLRSGKDFSDDYKILEGRNCRTPSDLGMRSYISQESSRYPRRTYIKTEDPYFYFGVASLRRVQSVSNLDDSSSYSLF